MYFSKREIALFICLFTVIATLLKFIVAEQVSEIPVSVSEIRENGTNLLQSYSNIQTEESEEIIMRITAKMPAENSLLPNRSFVEEKATATSKVWADKEVDQLWKELAYPKNTMQVRQVMQERRELIRRTCDLLELQGQQLTSRPTAFHVLSQYGIGWCPVYKAGSSNWKKYLTHLTGIDIECSRYKAVGVRGSCLHNKLQRYNHPATPLDQLKSLESFLVVRHPFERVVSAFRDKVQSADKVIYYNRIGRFAKIKYRRISSNITSEHKEELIETADQVVRSHNKSLTPPDPLNPYLTPLGPTFPEFSKAVLLDHRRDMHWVPYERWCAPCATNFSSIAKFETLNRDNLYVLRSGGLNISGFKVHVNPTSQGNTGQATWHSYFRELDPELLQGYKELYKLDCLLFGYDCDVSQFLEGDKRREE